MKKILTALFLFAFFSCKKEKNRPIIYDKPFIGIYDGLRSDTCLVSYNGEFAIIKWLYPNNVSFEADSVRVSGDTAFSVNETVAFKAANVVMIKVVGNGSFLVNRMIFNFVFSDGGTLHFDGVKR